MVKENPKVITLEIGSSKIACVISEILPDKMLNILGRHSVPSRGIYAGVISDIAEVTKAVKSVIDQACHDAEVEANEVVVSINGSFIQCDNRTIEYRLNTGKVTEQDLEEVRKKAHMTTKEMFPAREILHILEQEYQVDYQPYCQNPLDFEGKLLKARMHVISCDKSLRKNFETVLKKCGLTLYRLIYSGLASSDVVLSEEEKQGVCVVDIGGGTTDIALYTGGKLRYSVSWPYGGINLTKIISNTFGISYESAEYVKCNDGSAIPPLPSEENKRIDSTIIGSSSARVFTKKQLCELSERYYYGILKNIGTIIEQQLNELQANNLPHHLVAGIVFTGGATRINGFVEASRKVACMSNLRRIGVPNCLSQSGLTDYVAIPEYSTVLGLQYYYEFEEKEEEPSVMQKLYKKIKTHFMRM